MANIKSAKKRAVTNEISRVANKAIKTNLKSTEKRFLEIANSDDDAQKQVALKEASQKFDMAASKGIIHKNVANRKKSQFAKKLTK